MPVEIALSDGTKIRHDTSANDFTEELQRMAYSDEGPKAAPYGDWIKFAAGVWVNPAQVVYVKDVETSAPMAASQ